ncbi:MAG: membrane-targeted effector domain-containing toxin [Pseudomonas sp.]|uniref:membrane-targeted effector domain-containing toxin n=1 Tax=Pseudomonas sp. TaxID=306 RepID=UPI002391BE9D|nr:membrane-targeted effector domain-containing toxin [Pseudomonas sp.]MDE1195429.1 membrane-targeted effector domain-containing toxin [Pseudomonas sp.]
MPSHPPPLNDTPADHALLKEIALKLVLRCPDMRELARKAALDILRKHDLEHLQPDAVYWHRFDRSLSSHRTFSGWQHMSRPIESLTLPQLIMHRFNANDQDNADNLQMMGGFYTAGPDAEVFDETNEVPLLPQSVMKELWPLDFKTRFTNRMAAFWKDCADDFRTLAKANFIGKAMEELESGRLGREQFDTLMKALGLNLAQPIGLSMLQAHTPLGSDVRVATLDIAGYEASDILRFVQSSGRQFLYLPGETDAFHVFETADDLQWWLMTHTDHADNRAQFMSHFPLSTHSESGRGVGLNHALDLMFSNWGPHAKKIVNSTDRTVTGDPFTHLRDACRTRMHADADFALHSNGEIRKQMWIGYLQAFGKVFGAMAAIDWPIALAVVGAGLADVGLNIDQAIHAHTTAERKQAVTCAILASIDVLFNSLFLLRGADLGSTEVAADNVPRELPEPREAPGPSSFIEGEKPLGPDPRSPVEHNELLTSFETNEVLDGYGPPATEGPMRGVYQNARGETYVPVGDFIYRVRYASELNTWVIVHPKSPFSFYRSIPLRLDAAGKWEPGAAMGLRGGGQVFGKWLEQGPSTSATAGALPTRYDIPQELREALRADMESPSDKPFVGYVGLSEDRSALKAFFGMREKLLTDARAFHGQQRWPERPSLPDIPPHSSPKVALNQLYEEASGVVIGESHNSIASKRFLIDNMPLLAKQKVRTLYMEHLLTDLHQADLDAFAKTANMPEKLKAYLEKLDAGHHTDATGTYTFLNLVKAAHENHLRIRAIDCMSSYRVAGMPDPYGTLRMEMMNYFAHTVISADQAASGGGRWVALVGNAHANTFKKVAGIAELEAAIGLRIEDVAPGEPHGFEPDPGQDMKNELGRPAGRVKSDLRLQMEVAALKPVRPPQSTSIESRLRRPGTFIIQRNNPPQMIHRSGSGSIIRTPIKFDGSRVYIERPKWTYISGRRFKSLKELATALSLIGMRQVA